MRTWILVSIGAACLATSAVDFARWFRVSRWPQVPGKVVFAETRQEKSGARFRYQPLVDVEYQAAGKRYVTRTVRADSSMTSADRNWADRIVGQYSFIRNVQVHYNPADPSQAQVEIAPQPAIWVLFVWGCCALFAAWWFRP